MSALKKGLLLAALQVLLVASLAAKLSWDRARLPRVWARAGTYDPDLPIRGRYLGLQLEVKLDNPPVSSVPGQKQPPISYVFWGTLYSRSGQFAAAVSPTGKGVPLILQRRRNQDLYVLMEPVLFFLPEHAMDPWVQSRGGELWAEVTLPKKGPPRPIRLAVKRGDSFTPLEVK